MTRDEPSSIRWAPQALIAVAVAFGVFLILLAWSNWSNSQDIQALRELEEGRELVERWTIRTLQTDSVIGGEELVLEGDFVCAAAAIAADPVVQFRASYAPAGDGGLEVPRPLRPTRNITTSCTNESGPVTFGVPWDPAVTAALASINEPTDYIMFFSVEADGWVGASTSTNPFTVVPDG